MRASFLHGIMTFCFLAGVLFSRGAQATDPTKLLRRLSFSANGRSYSAIDIESYHLTYRFQTEQQRLEGRARIQFRVMSQGLPYLLMEPSVTEARLDGTKVGTRRVSDPDGMNRYLSLRKSVLEGSLHELDIRFTLDSSEWDFLDPGVAFLTSFTDVTDWKFLNRYAPANFESDAFSLTWDLEVDRPSPHRLFTNGTVTEVSRNRRWRVVFPSHYTSSGFYLHLTASPLVVRDLTYPGLEKPIPITVYGRDESIVDEAAEQLPSLFAELERDYGPYGHEQFIANMNRDRGGMEYEAATITSLGSLDHELLHSWFARGVKPAEGRSGWIDEAIASWRDYGYARKTPSLSRAATNLSSYSPFQVNTARNSYVDGRALLAELDMIFSTQGGYKSVLKEFFKEYHQRVTTTEDYLSFVRARSPISLESIFDRFVYGKTATPSREAKDDLSSWVSTLGQREVSEKSIPGSKGHPRPLTAAEERSLR